MAPPIYKGRCVSRGSSTVPQDMNDAFFGLRPLTHDPLKNIFEFKCEVLSRPTKTHV